MKAAVVFLTTVAACGLATAGQPQVQVARVLRVDGSEVKCLSCDQPETPTRLDPALFSVVPGEVSDWVSHRFVWVAGGVSKSFSQSFLGFLVSQRDEPAVVFRLDSGYLAYYAQECAFWDCMKPHLYRVNGSGKLVWDRKIPSLGLPVFPFVADDLVLFLSLDRDNNTTLVALDFASGKVVLNVALPKMGDYDIPRSDEYVPRYRGGIAVLPIDRSATLGAGQEHPAAYLVVEVIRPRAAAPALRR